MDLTLRPATLIIMKAQVVQKESVTKNIRWHINILNVFIFDIVYGVLCL